MRYSSGSHPLVAEKFDPLPIVPNREELMRYLGYKGPSLGQRTLPGTLEQLLRDSLVYLQPKGSYSIYRIEQWVLASWQSGACQLKVKSPRS